MVSSLAICKMLAMFSNGSFRGLPPQRGMDTAISIILLTSKGICPSVQAGVCPRAGRYTGIKSMLRYFVCTDIDIKQIFLYWQTRIP